MGGITSSDESVKQFLETDGWPDHLKSPASRSLCLLPMPKDLSACEA
jgi:hypothetical protein